MAKSEIEKKFDDLRKSFREECRPHQDEFRAAEKKAKNALKKISEKYGFPVHLGLESYAPESYFNLDEDMQELINDHIGGIDDYGQERGEWWSPSTC